jgi:hypothetical protein
LAFQVDLTEPALHDAEDYVRFVREIKKDPKAAERWFRGLVQAIYSLEELPELPVNSGTRAVLVRNPPTHLFLAQDRLSR